HFAKSSQSKSSAAGTNSLTYAGTFADISANFNCSSWSAVSSKGDDAATPMSYARWQIPNGTTLNTIGGHGSLSSNEIGIDMTIDEIDNPASCNLVGYLNNYASHMSASSSVVVLILCIGDISWIETDGGNATSTTVLNIDFYEDNLIPELTNANSEIIPSIITHSIPSQTFSSTINTAFSTALIENWEEGNEIHYKLTNESGDDSGWNEFNIPVTFEEFSAEPTKLVVKIIPTSTSPTDGVPSIKGFYVREL
ncbi:hypothetical protein ACFLQ9_02035, partial [Bacteroidota bacterium]